MIEYKEVTPNTRTHEGYEKIIWEGGTIYYQLNGMYHREDGPAMVFPDGSEFYFLKNIQVRPDTYHLFSPLELAKLGLI